MESGRVSPSEIDGIPGLVAIMTPDGAVDATNPQVCEYLPLRQEFGIWSRAFASGTGEFVKKKLIRVAA